MIFHPLRNRPFEKRLTVLVRREKKQEPLEFVGALKRDQEIGLEKNPRGNAYIARSLYAPQLEKLFALFAREQVLVLKYETFRADPFSVIDQVFDFIGVGRRSGLKRAARRCSTWSRRASPSWSAFRSRSHSE